MTIIDVIRHANARIVEKSRNNGGMVPKEDQYALRTQLLAVLPHAKAELEAHAAKSASMLRDVQ